MMSGFTAGSIFGSTSRTSLPLSRNLTTSTISTLPQHISFTSRRQIHTSEPASNIPTTISSLVPDDGLDLGLEAPGRNNLRMIMFGKPGSGKGTLSSRLVTTFPSINLITVGDVLRREIVLKTELGKAAESLVAKGEFVSDDIMLSIVLKELRRLRGQDWLLDGFPRTLHQGVQLDKVLAREKKPLNLIINLAVDDDLILRRIADRYVHIPSGRVYNSSYNAPKVAGRDDITGEPLSKRPDDTPEIFGRRLELFKEHTAPLLDYYRKTKPGMKFSLHGETSDEVWPELSRLVQPFVESQDNEPHHHSVNLDHLSEKSLL